MNELLSVLANLINFLQKKDLILSKVIPLITSASSHLKDIGQECDNADTELQNNVQHEISQNLIFEMPLIRNEGMAETFKGIKKYCEHVAEEI